jgi:prepilin-type N-terminal cleavage/methylation domain-containing protein
MRFIAVRILNQQIQDNVKSRGFTLMEMMITIVIMLILTIIIRPRMPSVDFYKAYSFSQAILYDINLTKVFSMSQNQRYRLVIGSSSYQIQDQNGTPISPPETLNTVMQYPTGVTVTPANTTIIFDSLGQPYDGNTIGNPALTTPLTLTVSSSGINKTISITPQTGFIQ